MSHEEKNQEKHFNIVIDKNHYKVAQPTLTGQQLKSLADVPSNYDLFEENPGSGDDIKIEDTSSVSLKSGLKFFSVPNHINPGGEV